MTPCWLLVLLCSPLWCPEGVEGWGGLSTAPSESECRPYIEKALKELSPETPPKEAVDATGSEQVTTPSQSTDQEGSIEETEEATTKDSIEGESGEEAQAEGEGESTEAEETEGTEESLKEETTESEEGAQDDEHTESTESTETQESTPGSVEEEPQTQESGEEGKEESPSDEPTLEDDSESDENSETKTEANEDESEIKESAETTDKSTNDGQSEEEKTKSEEENADETPDSSEAEGESLKETEGSEEKSGEEATAEEKSTEEKPEESAENIEKSEEALASTDNQSTEESTEIHGGEITDSSEKTESLETTESVEATESTEAGSAEGSAEEPKESAEETAESYEASVEETAETPVEDTAEESTEEKTEGHEEDTIEKATEAHEEDIEESKEETTESSAEVSKEETTEAPVEEDTTDESAEETTDEPLEDTAEVSAEETKETTEEGSSDTSESSDEVAKESPGESGEAAAESTEEKGTTAESEEASESIEATPTVDEAKESTEEAQTESTEESPDEQEATEEEESEKESEPTVEDQLTLEFETPKVRRPRDHIAEILHLTSDSAETELLLAKTIETTLKDLKKLYDNAIRPLEILFKYRDLSNRHFGDPEIFSKPLILFMGPWSGGKSTIVNYLLDNEFKTSSLRTGAEPSPAYFNILMWGEREEVLDGTQLAADWTFSGLQKFGQGLLDRLRGLRLNNPLLEKVNIVEIPGILEIRKQVERLFPFNDACQWFIDRADIIFLVYDPSKLDVGPETEAILDQLKGREYQTRIILNKADQVKPEELMRVQGTLIWNISPLMSSQEPPVMYSTSLWSIPYEQGSPSRLLHAQERAFLRDLRQAVDKRVENKIASARRFAVRVRNHAKMVDCYLTTYYNHKSFFGNRKKVADDIIDHPQDYHIYEGLSTLTNISRYDLPDPEVYRDFFRLNALYDFQRLSDTCTYFRGCPINRLDVAIAYDLPELVGKYKKQAEKVLEAVDTQATKS